MAEAVVANAPGPPQQSVATQPAPLTLHPVCAQNVPAAQHTAGEVHRIASPQQCVAAAQVVETSYLIATTQPAGPLGTAGVRSMPAFGPVIQSGACQQPQAEAAAVVEPHPHAAANQQSPIRTKRTVESTQVCLRLATRSHT